MDTVLLKNARPVGAADHSKPVSILIVDGRFSETFEEEKNFAGATTIDAADMLVLPGFIDVHDHGAVGVDVNAADTDGLLEVAGFLAKNGVTAWLPTLVPDSGANYRRTISAIDKLIDIQAGRPVAQAVGVHYEGIFASERMCGALRPEFFKRFTGSELSELPKLKKGVHMMTLAPEVEGGIPLIEELVRRGWIVSIGHTHADAAVLDAAFRAGARHMTHFYNAMSGAHHREIGVVGWGLMNKEVTFDIIGDGIHVHPKMLEFACRVKSPEKVSLISDSVAPTGMGDGQYYLWGETITVENGRTLNQRGSIAGSVITMLDAVQQMLSLGFSETDVSRMASANPAKLIGVDRSIGSIEIGKRADLLGFDDEGNLKMVMIGGRSI